MVSCNPQCLGPRDAAGSVEGPSEKVTILYLLVAIRFIGNLCQFPLKSLAFVATLSTTQSFYGFWVSGGSLKTRTA